MMEAQQLIVSQFRAHLIPAGLDLLQPLQVGW